VRDALPEVRSLTLPNMVEVDTVDLIASRPSLLPPDAVCVRIVYVGHVIPTKGVRELVAACVKLQGTPLSLDIVGPAAPAFQKELEQIARERDGGRWLRFHGKKSHEEAIQYIAHADIFTLPSYTEGMPNVILEAMAVGRAIVATTVGAIPEMLDIAEPQPCGVCIAPRDVYALSEALARLIDRPQERQTLGGLAKQRIRECFDVPIGCAKLLELWKSVSRNE
jgi:glycosyltransferase involved in cell wall biosynthesis